MKILIVGMPESIHTVRWINQINEIGWKVYLFPSISSKRHSSLHSVKYCSPFNFLHTCLKYIKLERLYDFLYRVTSGMILKIFPNNSMWLLNLYITFIRPDIIHTLETQNAGYLLKKTKDKYFKNKQLPLWWHTNWGSDIYLFGRFPDHKPLIAGVLKECDYYSCECNRDVELGRLFGFNGHILPVYPNTGGFNLVEIEKLRKETVIPSKRKIIMLKGYQGWVGRSLVGIRALERCADILSGYTIVIYSNTNAQDVQIAANLFSQTTGVLVLLLPEGTSHKEILKYHSMARTSIGLSISDGISTSLLEAMAMGSFPIQSFTAAADEWVKDLFTGLLVPPEDPEIIELAIRKVLSEDEMVDKASIVNFNVVKERLCYETLKNKTIESYNFIAKHKNKR